MSKKRPKASNRIFYTAPRKWMVWKVLMSGPAIALYCLSALFIIVFAGS